MLTYCQELELSQVMITANEQAAPSPVLDCHKQGKPNLVEMHESEIPEDHVCWMKWNSIVEVELVLGECPVLYNNERFATARERKREKKPRNDC